MANLIDDLIPVIDSLRASLYPDIGVKSYTLTRIIRTWSGGEVGLGSPSSAELVVCATPEIEFKSRRDDLSPAGRIERGGMVAKEISLTFTETQLRGGVLTPGQECYYKLAPAQSQAEAISYWVVDGPPVAERDNCQWVVTFKRYEPAT